jgi:predicted nucleic acid-binding protein
VASKPFLDSNILVYAVGPESPKVERARNLLADGATISVQVLNEFVNVSRKRLKQDWQTIEEGLAAAHDFCEIVPLTRATHERAVEIGRLNHVGIYDANILAAADLSGCDVLYTEDMNHGQRIGRLEIRNPFK